MACASNTFGQTDQQTLQTSIIAQTLDIEVFLHEFLSESQITKDFLRFFVSHLSLLW